MITKQHKMDTFQEMIISPLRDEIARLNQELITRIGLLVRAVGGNTDKVQGQVNFIQIDGKPGIEWQETE